MQKTEKKTRFMSLQIKLLLGFTLLFSLVFAAAFYWFYTFATTMALGRITEDLVDTMHAAAEGIDGDQLQALYTEATPREDGYTDDPRYWEQVQWLASVKRIEPRAAVYTYIKGEEPGELIFITSGGAANNPPTGAQFLEHWITGNPGPNLAGLVNTTLQDESSDGCIYMSEGCKLAPYVDDWGKWVSAFTPVKNSKGEVVAGLGFDFRADYVFQVQDAIRSSVVYAFAIVYLTIFVLVYFVSKFLTRPIIALTRSAEAIGEGNYESGQDQLKEIISGGNFPDEISILSRVFASMVGKVYQREQTLRRQVEELKIEIDEAKRQSQVGEIVETDFFRELQAKAMKMRNKRSPEKSDPES